MIYYYKLKIILPLVHYLVSLLINDKGIMDKVLKLRLFDKEELYLFNFTRILYKVTFLLDLTNRDISYITIKVVENKELGIIIRALIIKVELQEISIAFVDDADFATYGIKYKNKMQQILNAYTSLFKATDRKV